MIVQNADAPRIIRQQAGLTLSEGFPNNLSNNVQAVMDMTPAFHRITKCAAVSVTASATSNNILVGNNDNKDTYLTGFYVAIMKDSTCDTATGSVNLNVTVDGDGASTVILRIPVITLTAQETSFFITLRDPIKVKRNTNITLSQATFTVGNFIRAASLFYYEVIPTV